MTLSTTMSARAIVDGQPAPVHEAMLAVTDEGVARGDGGFETVGVWDGVPFRLDDHLDRLDATLEKILLPASDRARLKRDTAALLQDAWPHGPGGDAALRCYVTASGTHLTTLSPRPPRPPARWLVPHLAPWIHPPAAYAPAGAKTMSYGPNMVATRAAQQAGGDDALLLATDGTVLEGPTFCFLWVVDGVLHAVPVERGIVDSISRRTILELAAHLEIPTRLAEVGLDALADASEVLICSSVRDVLAVERVGPHRFPGSTPVRDRLAAAVETARRGAWPPGHGSSEPSA